MISRLTSDDFSKKTKEKVTSMRETQKSIEEANLTFRPKVNSSTNEEYEKYKVKVSQGGTRHIDLYKLANLKNKRNLTKEETEYDKNKDQLSF